jgi:hypothetical protein
LERHGNVDAKSPGPCDPESECKKELNRTTIVLNEFINNEKVYTGIHSIVSLLEEKNKDATS